MTTTNYLSFLRGINVSGQKIIKMQDLAKLFKSFGFNNVKTYLQTGNVLFDSDETDSVKIIKIIDDGIYNELGYRVTVILRTKQDLLDIVESEPFKDYNGDVKYYMEIFLLLLFAFFCILWEIATDLF